jgi:hypothetical protein
MSEIGSRRDVRPERIVIGNETMIRNDVVARDQGRSERGLNREDRLGAPFLLIGGVKYRPMERYEQFKLTQIRAARPLSRHQRRA